MDPLTEKILYGVCYQSDSKDNEQCNTQIIPTIEAEQIDFNDYTFNTSIGAETIDCIWFDSQISAYSVQQQTKPADFQTNQDDVQANGSIVCGNQEIHIDDSAVQSRHLCSSSCTTCGGLLTSNNVALTYNGEEPNVTDAALMVPSMFGISSVIVCFLAIVFMGYCYGFRYRRWYYGKSHGNDTEQIVDEVLDEIAKYTIGDYEDEEEGFDGDSDDNTDTTESDEELGIAILRVISMNPDVPEKPNPSLYSSDEDESDEEQCRVDLQVAKETLYATSLGSGNPYVDDEKVKETPLSTIEETIVEKRVYMNRTGCGRVPVDASNKSRYYKQGGHHGGNAFLSGGESSDCKISSSADAGGNSSDLP